MFILTFAVIGLSVFFYISGMKTTLLLLSVFLSVSLFGQSTYMDSGIEHGQKGEYQEAIDDFTTAIKINPDYASAYNNRGGSKYYLGLDGCSDLKKAAALGGYVHPDAMKEICN